MVILFHKRSICFAVGACCVFLCIVGFLWRSRNAYELTMADTPQQISTIIVIDPGHGGQDGGAVSPDGVQESHINLEVSFRLRDLLALLGQKSVMTRTEDVSIHTPGVKSWKASDLQNRTALVNDLESSILLSIHQNSLPSSPVTHGAQVFYNKIAPAAQLSAAIQSALNTAINLGNEKQMKEAPSGIYLMKHITAPGILVECGFLSNAEETLRLQESSYQIRLAVAVIAGLLQGAGEEYT